MSSRARAAMTAAARIPPKSSRDRVKLDKEEERAVMSSQNACGGVQRSRRDRRITLKKDVDKLRKMLRHEEGVHRALERAFTRPLGTLPRLPPYLPPKMLELLAEVAVLEEEVVRLEEQVVNFRWGLYQEAIYMSSSKKAIEDARDVSSGASKLEQSKSSSQCGSSEASVLSCNDQSSPSQSSSATDHNVVSSSQLPKCKRAAKKPNLLSSNDQGGKENKVAITSPMVRRRSPQKKVPRITNMSNAKATGVENGNGIGSNPNRISEELLKCLSSIFLKMSPMDSEDASVEMVPWVSGLQESAEDVSSRDPYCICPMFGKRDIGPYKNFRSIGHKTINRNLVMDSSAPMRSLRLLLRKLELVDLHGLNHPEKLAFWINIYNSCMMNTFLEHGIPATPQMVVALMQKAVINVGGHLLSAMTIEHSILRLPFDLKYAFLRVSKKDEMASRSNLGLDWPEPLVTFALSCGSWSSPAVRVYTASQVENELESAKRDYLQAAIGVSPKNKLAIPKLLDWYLLDFAKDIESLLDWICLQLPDGLRHNAVKCIERGRRGAFPSQNVQVLPYEFMFRYLVAT